MGAGAPGAGLHATAARACMQRCTRARARARRARDHPLSHFRTQHQVKNIKTYYKPDDAGGSVPYLPFLVGVVVALLLTTAVVVSSV